MFPSDPPLFLNTLNTGCGYNSLASCGCPSWRLAQVLLFAFRSFLAVAVTAATASTATGTATVFDSRWHRFEVVVVAEGLAHPWGMAFLPDGDMLITERHGALRRIHDGEVSAPIHGSPPVYAMGQGGLMDLALHPRFADNGWVYFTHSSGPTPCRRH